LLKQVKGVGTLIALTYVLTLDDLHRFRRSRDAECFVGLRHGRMNSGIRATLRRSIPTESLPPFVPSDLTVDFDKRLVTLKGQRVHLTKKEFDLFGYLIANRGKCLSHRRVLQAVWGPDYGDETEYLRVFINQLRKKIETAPHHPR
jgi:two-component system KDP operon response regulator KdpE